MALTRKAIPSPNYSSRGGASVRLIVIHTAEGATTIESLGSYFQGNVNASSHTGIDDKPGVIGEYVRRDYKAWTAANANPVAVQTELCAFAKWSAAEWAKHPNMLANCAAWIAEEAKAFDIPITKLTSEQAQGNGRGVCQHNDLGSWGGGHWDCGTGFPIDDVLEMARSGGKEEDDDMAIPAWFWDWSAWYLNTSRDPAKRPKGTPDTIPQWAWDYNKEISAIANNHGMTEGERDWIDWLATGKKGPRPDVPSTIPEFWWKDNEYVSSK